MSRWHVIRRLLRRAWDHDGSSEDIDEARRQHIQELAELAYARSRRHVVEQAAQTVRHQRVEGDFADLVEKAFGRRKP